MDDKFDGSIILFSNWKIGYVINICHKFVIGIGLKFMILGITELSVVYVNVSSVYLI